MTFCVYLQSRGKETNQLRAMACLRRASGVNASRWQPRCVLPAGPQRTGTGFTYYYDQFTVRNELIHTIFS
jgi:hypothetical protein